MSKYEQPVCLSTEVFKIDARMISKSSSSSVSTQYLERTGETILSCFLQTRGISLDTAQRMCKANRRITIITITMMIMMLQE